MKELHSAAKANESHTHAQSDITGLATALSDKANKSHTHSQSDITNLTTTLTAKAPLASPAFTGTPTAPTAADGTNSTQIATTAFVTKAVNVKQNKTVTDSDGAAVKNMVLVTDANGNIAASTYVTTTELNMLNNIRSNVQTQIDNITAGICIPDYSSPTTVNFNSTFTTPNNGILVVNYYYNISDTPQHLLLNIDGVRVANLKGTTHNSGHIVIPVGKGSAVVNMTGVYNGSDESSFVQKTESTYTDGRITFYPYK